MKLNWTKDSYKRYSADLGPISISVYRYGIGPDYKWTVGEIFGNQNLGRNLGFTDMKDAMDAAERIVPVVLRKAQQAFAKLGGRHGGGTVNGS